MIHSEMRVSRIQNPRRPAQACFNADLLALAAIKSNLDIFESRQAVRDCPIDDG